MKLSVKIILLVVSSFLVLLIAMFFVAIAVTDRSTHSFIDLYKTEPIKEYDKILKDTAQNYFKLIRNEMDQNYDLNQLLQFIRETDKVSRSVLVFNLQGELILKHHSNRDLIQLITSHDIKKAYQELAVKEKETYKIDNFEEFYAQKEMKTPYMDVYFMVHKPLNLVICYGKVLYSLSANVKLLERMGRESSQFFSTMILVVIGLVALITIIMLIFFLRMILLQPLAFLMKGVNKIGEGDFDSRLTIHSHDELGILADSINGMAGKILDLQEKAVESAQIGKEMQIAKNIQTALLPNLKDYSIKEYEISAKMFPAEEVGGDYYDFIYMPYDKLWFGIGDVSGHGLLSGLIMMMSQTAIRVALQHNPNVKPSQLVEMINSTITYNISKFGEQKYMTLTLLSIDKNGKLTFAGLHQDILIYRSQTKKVESVETNGMWIGLEDNVKGMFQDEELTLGIDDVILVYTDGLTEAVKKGTTEMYGQEQLVNKFLEYGDFPVKEIRNKLLDTLKNYQCDDDVTLVALRRKI